MQTGVARYSGWIKIYSEGRKSNFIYFILFFVKNNLFALLENDSYKVIASFLYYFFLPGEFLKGKKNRLGGEGTKEKKKEENKKGRKLCSFTGRQTCKTSTKENFFFATTLTGLKFWRNRKQTICAMLVSVHYIEIVQFFSAISFIIS